MDEWHYTISGEKRGPVKIEKIKALAAAGTLKSTDFLWKQGFSDWVIAGSIKGIFMFDAPLPLPGESMPLDAAQEEVTVSLALNGVSIIYESALGPLRGKFPQAIYRYGHANFLAKISGWCTFGIA